MMSWQLDIRDETLSPSVICHVDHKPMRKWNYYLYYSISGLDIVEGIHTDLSKDS